MKAANVRPTLTVYNALLKAAGQEALWAEAEGVMDDMTAMGVKPDQQSFHHLIQAYRGREAVHLWSILARMSDAGLPPTAQTFTLIIARPLATQNLELAIQGIAHMVSTHVVPELSTAQATIHLACERGYPKLALELAETFENLSVRRLDTSVWVACLASAADALYAPGVHHALQKVAEHGTALDEGLLLSILATAARSGHPALAQSALAQLKSIGAALQEHHLAPLIAALCAARPPQLQEALATLGLMRTQGIPHTPTTANPIVALLARSPDALDAAWAVLDELRAAGAHIDASALNALVGAAVRMGDVQRAVGAYKAFPEYACAPTVETFNLLLGACIAHAHRELGDRLLGEMKAAVPAVKPNGQTYERLVLLCLTQPTYEDAFFYLEEMKARGFLPTLSIYDAIVRKCVSVGDGRYKLALDEMKQCGYAVSKALDQFIEAGGVFEEIKINEGKKPMDEGTEIKVNA
ncbi:hypothetical protein HWV62_8337 [Athelia sp. TMB]|nr:hypothetical protein HWV62_8337 [Athelia sp. TMB]